MQKKARLWLGMVPITLSSWQCCHCVLHVGLAGLGGQLLLLLCSYAGVPRQ